MSATQAVKDYMETFKPEEGDTAEIYAHKMFDMQTEIYSAHAGFDLDAGYNGLSWDRLSKENKAAWLKTAEKQAKKFGIKLANA